MDNINSLVLAHAGCTQSINREMQSQDTANGSRNQSRLFLENISRVYCSGQNRQQNPHCTIRKDMINKTEHTKPWVHDQIKNQRNVPAGNQADFCFLTPQTVITVQETVMREHLKNIKIQPLPSPRPQADGYYYASLH